MGIIRWEFYYLHDRFVMFSLHFILDVMGGSLQFINATPLLFSLYPGIQIAKSCVATEVFVSNVVNVSSETA
jgi:hypothetical protein